MSSSYGIEVGVRGPIKGGYKLKVSFIELGMFIDGFRATRTHRNASGWWIQPPSFNPRNRPNGWKTVPEFDKKHSFWMEIETLCIQTVENNVAADDNITDDDLTEEAISENLDKAIDQLSLTNSDNEDTPKAIPWLNDEE